MFGVCETERMEFLEVGYEVVNTLGVEELNEADDGINQREQCL